MSNIQKIGNPARQSNNLLFQRRSLLKTLSLAALLPVGLGAYPSGIVIAADGVPLPENVMTPDAALKRLLDGNGCRSWVINNPGRINIVNDKSVSTFINGERTQNLL